MRLSREWAMPSGETFTIPPIRQLIDKYLFPGAVIVDPFARNSSIGTHTNDMNPETSAQYHLHSLEFLMEIQRIGVSADIVLFDPPYSLRQAKEIYENMGRQFTQDDTQQVGRWTREKEAISKIVSVGGVVLSFGWNSQGMGAKNGFDIEEVLLVCHGGAHNDTICTVERKRQGGLF